jgi:hypothetical protein
MYIIIEIVREICDLQSGDDSALNELELIKADDNLRIISVLSDCDASNELELIKDDDNFRISSALPGCDASNSGESRIDKRSDSESNFVFRGVSSGVVPDSQSKNEILLSTVGAFARPCPKRICNEGGTLASCCIVGGCFLQADPLLWF